MNKQRKILSIILVSTISIVAIGISSYFIYNAVKNKKDNNFQNIDQDNYKIHFATNDKSIARAIQFNVGQADCGLIQISQDNNFKTTNDNFNILIDIGVENKASNQIKKNLIEKIHSFDVINIDLMVFSHLHFDHIGAASYLINSNLFTFNNTKALFNWAEAKYFGQKLTATAKKLFNDLEQKKIQLLDNNQIAIKNDTQLIDFGNGNYFSVLSGGNDPVDKNNQNDWSIVTKFVWNNQSILYTGDLAGNNSQPEFFKKVIPKKNLNELKATILKSPHHGSSSEQSNNLSFLNYVSPQYVWISAGNNDQYTLPDVEPLNNYLAIGVNEQNIYGTVPFGKSLAQIKNENPNKTEAEINQIYHKWLPLNEWIIAHPLANNNNQGFDDIVFNFN